MKKIFVLAFLLTTLSTTSFAGHGGKHVLITINGLVCDFCARSMEKTFSKKDSVSHVAVDLTTKIVTLDIKKDMDLSDDDIKKGVIDAGYDVVDIKRD